MSKNKITYIVLLLALVGSNAFWVYQSIDFGISYTYMEASATDCHKMLRVAVAVIPIVADPNSGKLETVKAAEKAADAKSFEKDGLVWIDGLGLGFNELGRVIKASDGPLDSFWPQT